VLPEEVRELVLAMLRTTPVRYYLALAAYSPGHDPTELVPIASVRSERINPRAA
jgi:hypothetical protein